MSDSAAGTDLTAFGPVSTVEEDRLGQYYAYPENLTSCWVRANFISSLDGAATADGRSGALGGAGDRAVFRLMRELADVVVVGAGTVRIETYSGAQLGVPERQRRCARRQREVPPIAIVTRSADLDHDLAVFTQTEVPPLLLTTHDTAAEARARFTGLAEVYDCSDTDPGGVDLGAALRTLAGLGLTRVLAEGGPSLLGTFIADGLLDELCLTIAPTVVGGGSTRIADGHRELITRLRRRHVLGDDEGYLYTRYSRD
ncbi:pyrimidine reductase family protein [Mycolicibacterium frederiksbergense]|uniref:pyrimidine reductase family protein n=1 Tax=Mycolicibacterium frederiksbergense TaxID=117567 RepID=UPI00265C1A04|nr:pyrimidine reductase family protein [Mycolicibacterium frederiksbergense]MDO0977145.1 pyrimidine reductase family protein [Mycolicibacterium frederiksbergense]